MNVSAEQNEITETTEKETLALVPMVKVNRKKTERGKKMKYMKTWHKLNTSVKIA